jgi:hypothetical protein
METWSQQLCRPNKRREEGGRRKRRGGRREAGERREARGRLLPLTSYAETT